MLALLGLAGTTATAVAGWLAPILLIVSLAALGRAHYVLYFLKRGTRSTAVITWLATALVVAFWSWKLFSSAFA